MPFITDPATGQQRWSSDNSPAANRINLSGSLVAQDERIDDLEGNINDLTTGGVDTIYYKDESNEWQAAEIGDGLQFSGGTLRVNAHPSDEVDDRIDGLTANDSTKLIYSTQDHATPSYVRSATCWGADIDMTCISPWNSGNSAFWAGTAITPRHIAMANHAYVATNSTIRFITSTGSVVTRTVTNSTRVGSTDIRIGLLDSDLPSSITPAKLLPDDYARWWTAAGTAIAFTDQEEKLMVADITSLSSTLLTIEEPDDATRQSFYETPVSNDSGNPLFIIVNGDVVLIGCFTSTSTAGFIGGDNLASVLSTITSLGAYGHSPSYATFSPGIDAAQVRNPVGFSLPASVVTSGVINANRLGTGVVGSGALVLHDDGVFRAVSGAGLGDVSASANFATDNRLIRSDGTTKNVQASTWSLTDGGNMSATITSGISLSLSAEGGDGIYVGCSTVSSYALWGDGLFTGSMGVVGAGWVASAVGVVASALDSGATALAVDNVDGFRVSINSAATANRSWQIPDDAATTNVFASRGFVPQNSKSADYTLVATDAGKHIYHPSTDTTPRTFTIPANASVAFQVGTEVRFVNDSSAGAITIAITSDTLVLAGSGSTGSRTLAANGVATALKVTSTRWIISGTGLT